MVTDSSLSLGTAGMLLILAVFVAPVNAAPVIDDCFKEKFEKYLQVKKEWNTNLAKIAAEELPPRFAATAKDLETRETKLIEAERKEFHFLAKQHPEKLRLQRPVNQWVKLSPRDKKQLLESDKDYVSLQKYRWENAPSKVRANRKFMLSKIMSNRKFIAYTQEHKKKLAAIKGIDCKKP